MSESFLNGRVTLHPGDCLDVLARLEDCSVDSCVTDPPYHLTSVAVAWDTMPANRGKPQITKKSVGFMGKGWDGGDVAFRPETWAQVIRVLKPGGHLLAFGGTRTYHRMACAIEDAGFEIRDCVQWLYGSGFPKSHDVSKGIDRAAGAEREVLYQTKRTGKEAGTYGEFAGDNFVTEPATDSARQWQGWGTALKPACELIVLARKPLGTGNIDVRKNVERGIRSWGYHGNITWIGLDAENAAWSQPTSPEPEAKPEISAGDASVRKIENGDDKIAISRAKQVANGTPVTAESISTIPNAAPASSVKNSSRDTGDPAPAVERQNQNSLLSTTPTGVEASTARQSGHEAFMQTSSAKDSPKDTVPFAGIVTGLTGSMERVHITQMGSSFVWPGGLPTFVPSRPLNVAANVLKWGTGAINVDGARVAYESDADKDAALAGDAFKRKDTSDKAAWARPWMDDPNKVAAINAAAKARAQNGRWPANVIHDGSEEVVGAFPDADGAVSNGHKGKPGLYEDGLRPLPQHPGYADSGSASRFFYAAKPDERNDECDINHPFNGPAIATAAIKRFHYTSKADADDRLGSKHPTVKPLDLMQYLVRLVTPPRGLVLDPFAGTGTTGEAAWREGMRAVLIEREEEYQNDIRRRMALALAGPDERAREAVKARQNGKPPDHGPLFADTYDSADDVEKSFKAAYDAIKERQANGGPGWVPK